MPIVSVIMPMKDTEEYVSDAISSVLAQSFKSFELIIIDDGSTDYSRKITETFVDERIKVVTGPGKGKALAFNQALKLSKGKYLCICDSDDLFPEDRLVWQVVFLEQNNDIDAICGTYSTMNPKGKVLSQFDCGSEKEEISKELLTGKTRTSLCTFLISRNVIIEMDGFRSFFETSQDIDFQLRLGENYSVWYEPINSYFYRLHDSSITHSQALNKRKFFGSTARTFLKQRIAHGLDDLQKGNPPTPPDFEIRASSSRDHISGILTSEAWRLHREGHKMKAINKGMRVCTNKPFSLTSWRNLAALIIKSV